MRGAQTAPSCMHSRLLRGGRGAGMEAIIPRFPNGPWRDNSVGTIPLKPSAAPLELSYSSTVSIGRVIAQHG
ncbi:hypothetical protein [Nitrosomonas sp. Nm34]|uniref:hypothetical protein n=1 Tax=Nitrosomonas sp. Nm34 TaxID=1881055 RepID=UPI0011134A60|nr:hypothetical protein [Nitrosomonas sp. Nm34]